MCLKWLGRETRQPFLCKRAIITMTSILKPPWFKAWRCVCYGFSVFYFTFFYILISRKRSFTTKSMHRWHYPPEKLFFFQIQFYEMDNKANTFSFDYHKIWPSNSWIGNREVMNHDENREDPEIIRSKQNIVFVFLHLQQQHIQSWAFIGWLWCIFLLPSKSLYNA